MPVAWLGDGGSLTRRLERDLGGAVQVQVLPHAAGFLPATGSLWGELFPQEGAEPSQQRQAWLTVRGRRRVFAHSQVLLGDLPAQEREAILAGRTPLGAVFSADGAGVSRRQMEYCLARVPGLALALGRSAQRPFWCRRSLFLVQGHVRARIVEIFLEKPPMMQQLVERVPWPTLREMLKLMRVDRPVGTWLLLWPSLWALFAASHPAWPPLQLLLVFVAGAFVMRSAGCVANDMADRHFDVHVERTRERPLAAGRLSLSTARRLLLGLLVLALLLVLPLNRLTMLLALPGALLAVTYPLTKRWIHLPQFYMGAAFAWGVIMAWAAVTAQVDAVAWILFAATLTWAAGYDTIYGMVDRPDDLKIGIKSTAILFGRWDIAAVGCLYALTLALLAWAGLSLGLGGIFWVALAGAGVQMIWQLGFIRGYDRARLFHAFLSNQWTGLILFLGFVLG
ncbi:MAG: 4-hydroxybenzoate octaprenyltransferase [Magnetococcus sp. WYHC-3]